MENPSSGPKRPDETDLIHLSRKAIKLSESVSIDLQPLDVRGSDRTFYRLKWNQRNSVILIHYDPRRVENTLYAEIALFLFKIGLSVPKLIHNDPRSCLIIMEDLGDTTLWSLRNVSWEKRKRLYQKTLHIACRLHSISEEESPYGRLKLMEAFGPELYRWEQEYFKEHFIRNLFPTFPHPSFDKELDRELFFLSEGLSKRDRSLIHRDLQSQNVMVRENKAFLIDFQGMRFGNPFYDLGSLLCDPYVEFSEREREELLFYYYGLNPHGLDWDVFKVCFWEASAQRLMQALGAFGFLGIKKGLKSYLQHIPSGLKNLYLATSHCPSLTHLKELATKCLSSNNLSKFITPS